MTDQYSQLISRGALVALVGYLASGPIGYLVVQMFKPQPPWVNSSTFAQNYHVIQDLPFYFGFLLIGGMLMLSIGHYLNYSGSDSRKKFLLLMSLACTIVFCTLITFNYVCQTTFVRHLALNYKEEYAGAIATFSMANSMSLCWANEMWGYGVLGIATWLMSSYYETNHSVRALLVANGVISISTVALTVIDLSWIMTALGLSAYFFWNLLMIGLMILIYRHAKKNNAMKQSIPVHRAALACGILSSFWYLFINVYVPLKYDGYSMLSWTVSELSAIGSPTRSLWIILATPYPFLFGFFGWGVLQSSVGNKLLRVIGILIIAYSVFTCYWPPMHMRGIEPTLTDALHIVWAAVTVLLMIMMMVLGAVAFGMRFRLYTIGSIVLHIVFGILTSLEAPNIPTNGPTPWIGLWERINIAVFLVWVAVLGTMLLFDLRNFNKKT